MKTLCKGDIIRVKTTIEAYGRGGVYLTPDIEAVVINPKTPCVWVRENGPDTFVCVEFFSPIINAITRAGIMDRNNIIKVK